MLHKIPFIALITACLLATVTSGCGKKTAESSVLTVRPVKALTIEAPCPNRVLRFPGKVQAGRKVDLSFRVAGPLIELPVRAGQEVNKGDLIARIDPRDFKTDLLKAEAAFVEAQNQYHRHSKLFAKGAVSKSAYDSSKSVFLTAQAALEQARSALEDTSLKAPYPGIVAMTYVENHQDIKAQDPVVSLQDTSRLEVVAQVPEQDVAASGEMTNLHLSVTLGALPGREFPAKIKEFTTEADARTQTFTTTVILDHPEGINMLPGMTAELVARIKQPPDAVRSGFKIPVEAVLEDFNNTSSVWKIDRNDMTVHLLPVKVDGLTDDSIVVLDGLSPGDMIATAGVHHLRDGMKVTLLQTEQESNRP